MGKTRRKEYCFVPGCRNTGVNSPQKLFFTVPIKEPLRSLWIKASKRDTLKSPVNPRSHLYCCEDHFDVENDMLDYRKYIFCKGNGMSMRTMIKPGIVPHRNLMELPRKKTYLLDILEKNKVVHQILFSEEDQASSSSYGEGPSHQEPTVTQEYQPIAQLGLESVTQSADPAPELGGIKDVCLQVNLRPNLCSKAVQTKNITKRIVVDASTQITPVKQRRVVSNSSNGMASACTESPFTTGDKIT